MDLKKKRVKMGLTMHELAQASGLSTQQVWNIENGRASLPPSKFIGVSKTLKVSVKNLIDLEMKRQRERLKKKIGVKNG